ncbi:MAG: adenine phosphoribosyltransferase [Clostridiales bacterium]|nr:adenine phosphoribosyltransferase [Clostridiales bacterium]
MDLKSKIRTVENFPKEGISFKDITTLLQEPEAFKYAIDELIKIADEYDYDVIIGPEARGFIFSAPMAYAAQKPLVLVRKPGKLPSETESHEYALEYGTDVLEIHKDAIKKGDKVLIVDDLLATGGTTKAVVELVQKLGAEVSAVLFLIELTFLPGREILSGYPVRTVLEY